MAEKLLIPEGGIQTGRQSPSSQSSKPSVAGIASAVKKGLAFANQVKGALNGTVGGAAAPPSSSQSSKCDFWCKAGVVATSVGAVAPLIAPAVAGLAQSAADREARRDAMRERAAERWHQGWRQPQGAFTPTHDLCDDEMCVEVEAKQTDEGRVVARTRDGKQYGKCRINEDGVMTCQVEGREMKGKRKKR